MFRYEPVTNVRSTLIWKEVSSSAACTAWSHIHLMIAFRRTITPRGPDVRLCLLEENQWFLWINVSATYERRWTNNGWSRRQLNYDTMANDCRRCALLTMTSTPSTRSRLSAFPRRRRLCTSYSQSVTLATVVVTDSRRLKHVRQSSMYRDANWARIRPPGVCHCRTIRPNEHSSGSCP